MVGVFVSSDYYNKLPQIEGYRQQRWSHESVESETSPVVLG